ncbi:Serpentine receptor class H-72 [Caenorhabditis elegans]|uniref:Serpentine receptor class H-72 n=1 Tax=Caenorhabditis elegans TaxID=6239 RepID=SRH72_CAEEL|nr:Serpentine receptor class H-72 [Caenorhabditis elegans]P91536.1 RecName: Full=Serpentine receptor class H-72; Short=Protein srh-72 [Caenorhabditis elegans]CCD63686.1 Serpentine receptor class H-72 [Caenorhabditis elegans]|eukprot:NP_494021.1 Serpentine receptor class H-72 [Caenorhabditis elegans]
MSEASLSTYYTTIYPTKCPPDPRFLVSKEGLAFCCQIIGFISLPMHFFTGYCILMKTPATMKHVKLSLVNLNIWYIISQVIVSFFITSYNFYPSLASFSVGYATALNFPTVVQICILYTINDAVHVSITLLFEIRSSLILKNRFRISSSRGRGYWLAGNFFGTVFITSPVFFNLADQNAEKMKILEAIPCPSKEFFLEPITVFATSGAWNTYLLISRSLKSIYMLQIIFFTSCCIYYLVIVKTDQVSAQTRRIQARSFYGLIIQTLIPAAFTLIPSVLISSRSAPDQLVNNLVSISYAVHIVVGSLAILLVHHPYRLFIKSIFVKSKESVIVPVVSTSMFKVIK